PFRMTISEVFLTYHVRREENDQALWRKERGKPGDTVGLTDQEFATVYGPPPWDLLNDTMSAVGLNYRINNPEGFDDSLQYNLVLSDVTNGTQVSFTDLSSGEETLISIAMSLYYGSNFAEAIEFPHVLLLDDPDATLHPSMIRQLLAVVDDIIHKSFGVKVILVTHQPSTVALAPEDSLYTMQRDASPRVTGASSR